jgi:ATP-dependent Lhr-like helicase
VVLTENFGRYAAAFGADAFATVYRGIALDPVSATDAVPDSLRQPAMTKTAARREILARFASLAGAFSLTDVTSRYDLDETWIRERLDDWTRAGKLIRGTFGRDSTTERWCSRRLLELARRRELAQARKQIEAVPLDRFGEFMLRWQHLEAANRLSAADGTIEIARQMYGLARPAEQWENDYLPARVEGFDPDALSRLIALGELVWIGGSSAKPDEIPTFSTLRLARRGTVRAWVSPSANAPIGDNAQRVLETLERDGASFFDELLSSIGLTPRILRDALRELVGAGLVTNDTMDALRLVLRWRPIVSPRDRARPDPTRWLPADYTPSANRYVVQRRPNLRRLPKWKRPDKEGGASVEWPGRWSLVRAPRVLGPEADESAWAALIAKQWLERYGIVSREMWRRERPAIGWRSIYHELRRLEFRGDVRRGYFVRGLSGAQFALPQAIELLRADDPRGEAVVISATDPANVYTLPMPQDPARDPFVRPRSRGALLVLVRGTVVMIADRRGARIVVRPDTSNEIVALATKALLARLLEQSDRDIVVETIDGQPASGSRFIDVFRDAGFRRGTVGLRYYRSAR